MISVLVLTIAVLLFIIGGIKGIQTFFCFILNLMLILLFIYLAYTGLNVFFLTILIIFLASLITMFLTNGINKKTKSSMISIVIVSIIMFLLSYLIVTFSNIEGFSAESREIIGTFNLYINFSAENLLICLLLFTSAGTIMDTSISISSAVNEVYQRNKQISQMDLYNSGINIGKDILSTTINTIYFASIGGILTFFFWNHNLNFLEMINNKLFAQEFFEILICFIGSILIIPITSYFISKDLKK